MLELKNICWTTPDGEEIIKDISLNIPDGQMTVITGPNGSGKTSLAKIIAGLETPSGGSIFLDGEDITNWDITKRAQKGIGYSFQQPVRFKGLSVRDLMELASGEKMNEGDICEILGEVGLCANDYMNREVDASLSGGEIKRIEIATVLARKNTKILVFDEPEAGIDLWSFTGLIDAFQRLKTKHNEGLLIISHQERILDIADKIIIIANGKIREEGSRNEVLPTLLSGEKGTKCPLGKDRKLVFINE
ncbi:lipopolysaccharide export system ATP-binding protein LptB [Clostridiales bacterium]|nr:lipopolysaccharide export system ATP-binding protein LptB [Clostridiales bacterium]